MSAAEAAALCRATFYAGLAVEFCGLRSGHDEYHRRAEREPHVCPKDGEPVIEHVDSAGLWWACPRCGDQYTFDYPWGEPPVITA